MEVIIASKNLNTSDHLKETIESKFEKLDKYFSSDIVANVTLSMERDRQKIEATINVKGTIFRAEDTTNDIYSGIDRIVDKLSSQMSRFKSKLVRKHKDSKETFFESLPDSKEDSDADLVIAKRKMFDLSPMMPDEAILQMELLQHSFYVFMNMETESISVVYKRNDGKYGLLEPAH